MSKITSRWVDNTVLKSSQIDQPNGVAGLDGSGKLSASLLPTNAMEYKGSWNASTNSPAIADGGLFDNGDVFRVSVAGTQNLGSGSITFSIGDLVIYNGSIWQIAPQDSAFSGHDTDDLPEGATNLYFTESRVRSTVLTGFATGDNTQVGTSDNIEDAFGKLQTQINDISSITFAQEVFTLSAGDITNGNVTLANAPIFASMTVYPDDGPVQRPTADYTVTTNVLNFQGDLATTLIAGDVLIVRYAYN